MSYDYIIVGSGIAGLYAALLAQRVGSVLLLTKSTLDDCNTRHAQGGIAVAIAEGDSPELHLQDTLRAGAGLCDPRAVRVLVEEGPARINDLVSMGVPFDRVDGKIALTREAAHSVSRVVHAGGDATGASIETTLVDLSRQSDRITISENQLVTELLLHNGEVTGVRTLGSSDGRVQEFEGHWIVLATGGAGQLYSQTTNPEVATADGVTLAYRAGAEVADLEFFQFHPTALLLPGVPRFLMSEAIRGEGGILLNGRGERFAASYDSRGELAPRDVVTRAIVAEMARTGDACVYLDVTHLTPEYVIGRFPSIYQFCLARGLDLTREPIPVTPAAHYFMGGVRTNVWGETNVPRLFACGEAACTGIHGANRLASNSLLETLVFARRVIDRTLCQDGPEPLPSLSTGSADLVAKSGELTARLGQAADHQIETPSSAALQALMWDKVGIIRERDSLLSALHRLDSWGRDLLPPQTAAQYELQGLVQLARLMAEAALIREESRGAHFRSDFPSTSPGWRRHIGFVKELVRC